MTDKEKKVLFDLLVDLSRMTDRWFNEYDATDNREHYGRYLGIDDATEKVFDACMALDIDDEASDYIANALRKDATK